MRKLLVLFMFLTFIPDLPAAQLDLHWEKRSWCNSPMLFNGDKVVGIYHASGPYRGQYRPFDGSRHGPATTPPLAMPDEWRVAAQEIDEPIEANYGVDSEKIKDAPNQAINGKACTRSEAMKAVESGELPDDKDRLRLTVIGDDANRKKVLADLEGTEFAAWKDKLLIQDYAPGEWPLACGFSAKGNPTIYLQNPDGKVLHRQDDYADGANGLAMALRKVDPAYDATKDPDLRKSSPLDGIPVWVYVAGGAAVLFLLKQPEQSKS